MVDIDVSINVAWTSSSSTSMILPMYGLWSSSNIIPDFQFKITLMLLRCKPFWLLGILNLANFLQMGLFLKNWLPCLLLLYIVRGPSIAARSMLKLHRRKAINTEARNLSHSRLIFTHTIYSMNLHCSWNWLEAFCSFFNPIAYGIFSFFQLRGGGGGSFLARTPENTVRIVWLIPNLVQLITDIKQWKVQNFR